MLVQKVRNALYSECGLSPESSLVLGVSGGPDSMCLLDLISFLPNPVVIAHLDHNLRHESAEEAEFVKAEAKRYGYPFVSKSLDIKFIASQSKTGIEETARIERYQFLFDIARESKSEAVVVAHQADDQVETILMNLIRGSGLDGLAGMKTRAVGVFNEKIPVLRPLLNISRESILEYCDFHHVPYKVDSTNMEGDNLRAKLRNSIIPDIKKLNPKFLKSINRLNQTILDDIDFLEKSCHVKMQLAILSHSKNFVELNLEEFAKSALALQRRIIKNLLETYFSEVCDVSFELIEDIRKFFINQGSPKLTLRNRLFVFRDDLKGTLTQNENQNQINEFTQIINPISIKIFSGSFPVGKEWSLIFQKTKTFDLMDIKENKNIFKTWIDFDTIQGDITLRNWQDGDRVNPLGMHGHSQKVADVFINNRIPVYQRKTWPLLINKEKIIWIPGLRQCDDTKVSSETREVLIIELVRNKIGQTDSSSF